MKLASCQYLYHIIARYSYAAEPEYDLYVSVHRNPFRTDQKINDATGIEREWSKESAPHSYSLWSPTFHRFEEVKIFFFFKVEIWSYIYIPEEEELFFFFSTQLNYMLEFFERRRRINFLLLQCVIGAGGTRNWFNNIITHNSWITE